jgi:hypothetical protein
MDVARPMGPRFWIALGIAAAADVVQIALFPLFAEGALSPWNDGVDVVVAVALTWLLGFHWVLLPTLAAELVPAVDMVPTWTAAVLIVAWRKRSQAKRLEPSPTLPAASPRPR